ncbi:glycosyltransferase family 25 protein [Pseudomonas sp. UBA6323]|uniref:glycosyltransferase family 25 protein n=1 Tax=Pseudomonas sp. UBA6323 TaxID=1947329 RepID=UPI0025CCDC83|nr:glycosyltransferase family 25 protein [Pseudomonas sp. UBA6323]
MKNTPAIYLISLKSEIERREKLKAQFPLSYNTINLIDAIDKNTISSNDYFQAMMNTQKRLGKIISPAELACARSHLIAIQKFLESTYTHCLILEDDIIGTEQELEKALDATSQTSGNSIIFCGTHINRRHNKYITPPREKAKKINFLERHFIAGAFSYGLTRGAAQNITKKQRQATYRSDHWISLAQNLDIYIIDALKHPENYNNSHIESERQVLHKKTIEKIRHDGLGATITKNLSKILILAYQNIRRKS